MITYDDGPGIVQVSTFKSTFKTAFFLNLKLKQLKKIRSKFLKKI